CPDDFSVAFLDGTAPQNYCSQMSESPQNFIQRLFGIGGNKPNPQPAAPTAPQPVRPYSPAPAPNATPQGQSPETAPPAKPKKKNFFQKIFGGGGDKDNNGQSQSSPAPQ